MNKKHSNKTSQANSVSKSLHPKNLHKGGYDFPGLIKSHPALKAYVKTNQYNKKSIDFSDPHAVKALNSALLKYHYGIVGWDIPEGFLCPPVPGRVDYIHYVAELLNSTSQAQKTALKQAPVRLLDIGTGANGIYSLLASQVYGWQCTGSDIEPKSLDNVAKIINKNPQLKKRLQLRRQHNKNHIFEGIIEKGDYFDVSVCNPPFHASLKAAQKSNQQKVSNLARSRNEKYFKTAKVGSARLNFGGQKAELWCAGGERQFLQTMIKESKQFASQCRWFTTLISKRDNVKPAKKLLNQLEATDIQEIEMQQGNKITRILVWTFLTPA